jgi:serine/threonine-protein kinase
MQIAPERDESFIRGTMAEAKRTPGDHAPIAGSTQVPGPGRGAPEETPTLVELVNPDAAGETLLPVAFRILDTQREEADYSYLDRMTPAPGSGEAPANERYIDQGEIGRGGTSSVRLVFDRVLNRDVAMKVLSSGYDPEDRAVLRFMKEAQTTAQLDHPNIVPVHDMGVEGSKVFFTMKLVGGRSLAQLFAEAHARDRSPERLEQLLRVFSRVCDAVSFAHSRGVVHRDLKPTNIMVGSHGQVYVMDWGASRLLEESPAIASVVGVEAEEPGTIIGTATYMAPEQAWGQSNALDERTDVFGLGAILYHLLTGRGPHFHVDPQRALGLARACAVASPEHRCIWTDPPVRLCEIAHKALSVRQSDRQQTVDELKHEVEEFLQGGGWFRTRFFTTGEHVVTQGGAGDEAYIIQSGRCRVWKSVNGQEIALGELGPGDVFGEAAVLTEETRTASVTAIEPLTVKVVTRATLDHELNRNPWLSSFVRALARRFVDLDARSVPSQAP